MSRCRTLSNAASRLRVLQYRPHPRPLRCGLVAWLSEDFRVDGRDFPRGLDGDLSSAIGAWPYPHLAALVTVRQAL